MCWFVGGHLLSGAAPPAVGHPPGAALPRGLRDARSLCLDVEGALRGLAENATPFFGGARGGGHGGGGSPWLVVVGGFGG